MNATKTSILAILAATLIATSTSAYIILPEDRYSPRQEEDQQQQEQQHQPRSEQFQFQSQQPQAEQPKGEQPQEDQPQEERQFLWDSKQFRANAPQRYTAHRQNDPYCFAAAEQRYAVSEKLLRAISKVESGHRIDAVNWNGNKSYDYGHMQINSSWAPIIGPEAWNNLSDPCYCTMVGAWILSQCVRTHGYTWKAVGCYNARTKSKAIIYSKKVEKALNSLKEAKQ